MENHELMIREGERLDDLQRGGLRILQRPDGFRFGTDAVLLADFAGAKRGEHICDMGTGTGVLPLLLSARAEGTTFDAFEIQHDVADMAMRSVQINGLQDRIRVHCADCRDAARMIGHECCHLVVSNPPYTRQGAGLVSPEKTRALSRSDSDCSLEEWIAACGRVLRNGGRLCCVFPAPRFLELCDAMRSARVEPKRVCFVAARPEAAPKLVLLEGLKGGRPGLHVQPLLITHEADGSYTRRMREIYGEI
ncbi:MAG: tRNA1(Val) (adenine(37)-N6)-methyltransferase [Clostridia bacterium]|nr:tRNA1(Val) (adenine(37)-N6)-methyltransferase [Clostridia bacterium]